MQHITTESMCQSVVRTNRLKLWSFWGDAEFAGVENAGVEISEEEKGKSNEAINIADCINWKSRNNILIGLSI